MKAFLIFFFIFSVVESKAQVATTPYSPLTLMQQKHFYFKAETYFQLKSTIAHSFPQPQPSPFLQPQPFPLPAFNHLPGMFCKMEHKIESKSKFAPRFRLGSLNYTNWMEGKGELYSRYWK